MIPITEESFRQVIGQIIKARIDTCHEGPSKGGSVPIRFQVIATEITE